LENTKLNVTIAINCLEDKRSTCTTM